MQKTCSRQGLQVLVLLFKIKFFHIIKAQEHRAEAETCTDIDINPGIG